MDVTYNNLIELLDNIKIEDNKVLTILQNSNIVNDIVHKQLLKNSIQKMDIGNDDIIDLLVEDYTFFNIIIQLHYEKMINWIDDNKNWDFIQNEINKPIIENNNTNKKVKLLRFNQIIFNWLKNNNFFFLLYNDKTELLNELKEEPIINENKEIIYNWRDNQLDAINRLNKNGLETGIHCQATGCGKSNIILYYIDYVFKNFKNPVVILFTERVNILKDLFCFVKDNKKLNENKMNEWKNNGICDLLDANIINRVTEKQKNWINMLIKPKKPTLLVINRAFLTINENYKKITKLHLIIHDECHNTASEKCHNFLVHCKNIKVPIVGFSATPIRTFTDIEIAKLKEIYAVNNALNILTDYNMIHAISKDLILPPEFFWYQLESYNEYKKDDKKDDIKKDDIKKDDIKKDDIKKPIKKTCISDLEIGSVLDLLNEIIVRMPNKKIVAWCGTIDLCTEWKSNFEKQCKYRKNLKDFTFGIDHSKNESNDYNIFRKSSGKMILFCANKHREGSDIPKLDGCIFLDKVKIRSASVFIQSIGRVLRKCNDTPNKDKGFIFDGIVKDSTYDKVIAEKIIGYYLALHSKANIIQGQNKLINYYKIKDIIDFDTNEIKLNIGKNMIKINCKNLEWKEIENKLSSIIQHEIGLSEEDILRVEFKKLKEEVKKEDIINKKDYNKRKLDHWPDNPKIKYNSIWKDFYDFIGVDINKFPNNKNLWLEKCRKYNLNSSETYLKNYFKYNLPCMPEEIYKNFGNLNDELTDKIFVRR